jgi:uncharacterized protein (UPF0333 family)
MKMKNNFKNKNGQIALPFVLLVGGIIIEIVLAGSFMSFFVNTDALGNRLSVRALSAANTGVYDAIMKISRNKSFGATEISYEIVIGDDTVNVVVSRTEDEIKDIYLYNVESLASARNRQKKVVAVIVVDKNTGKINLQSINEDEV